LPPYWEDESPWNEVEPWKDDNIYSAANSNELALAA
jgi:hypothetical protein